MSFIVFPAIDLRHGQCVRLQQGQASRATFYGADPMAVAARFREDGATWVHVVNLDGALEDDATEANLLALQRILMVEGLRVQFGGGVRSLEVAARLFELGVSRVIFGTVLVAQPSLAEEAVSRFGPERVVAALDAREGRVAIRGWQVLTDLSPEALGRRLAACGVRHVLYTAVERDGMLVGADVDMAAALAQTTGLRVLVSGGVRSLEDVARAASFQGVGVEGVVIGKALYEGLVRLPEALAVAAQVVQTMQEGGS